MVISENPLSPSEGVILKRWVRKMKPDQMRWDKRFKGREFAFGKEANPFLRRHIGLLPTGKALDIATGEGRNAVFLARYGFDVDAVDISKTGLKKARNLAKEAGAD